MKGSIVKRTIAIAFASMMGTMVVMGMASVADSTGQELNLTQNPATWDIVIHVKELIIKTDHDPGIFDGVSDPYVKIKVRECGQEGRTKTENGVAPWKHARRIECSRILFKNCSSPYYPPEYNIEWWVKDDDPWTKLFWAWDDLMAYGKKPVHPPKSVTINHNTRDVNLTLVVDFYRACTGGKTSNARGNRSVPTLVTTGEPFNVTLTLDINEGSPPKGVTVEEMIPNGFKFVGASPPPTSFEDNTMRWHFEGIDVHDRRIVYTLVPYMTGVYDFGGHVINDTEAKAVISGDWCVNVEPNPYKPVAYISTDKHTYKPKDTMITIINLVNPTDESQVVSLVWDFRTTDSDYWIPLTKASLTLPPNSDESYLISIPVGYWAPPPGFEGIWRITLLDHHTMDVISYDATHWTYVPGKACRTEKTPTYIAEEIRRIIETEFP